MAIRSAGNGGASLTYKTGSVHQHWIREYDCLKADIPLVRLPDKRPVTSAESALDLMICQSFVFDLWNPYYLAMDYRRALRKKLLVGSLFNRCLVSYDQHHLHGCCVNYLRPRRSQPLQRLCIWPLSNTSRHVDNFFTDKKDR